MQKPFIKSYKFSLCCIALIWILCFCTVPQVDIEEEVPFIDKWVHILMYAGTCGVIRTEYLLRHSSGRSNARLCMWAILAPILMSGGIELLQAYCTGGRRSGDWLDFAANTVGVLLAALFGQLILRRYLPTRSKDASSVKSCNNGGHPSPPHR